MKVSSDFANLILRTLPTGETTKLRSLLKPVELNYGDVIYRAGEPIEHVYFPESGLISIQTVFTDGAYVESGLIGVEGAVGTCLALSKTASNRQAFVQISGSAYRLRAKDFSAALERNAGFNRIILRFVFTLIEQAAQIGACNCSHVLERRLARMLLLCRDRTEIDLLRLTQDQIAQILAVNRPSASIYAKQLKDAGLIDYKRGGVQIIDHARLEAHACECYPVINQLYNDYTAQLIGV